MTSAPYDGTDDTVPTPEERVRAGRAHTAALWSMVLSLGLLGWVVSLVVWSQARGDSTFVRRHAANAANIQVLGVVLVVVSYLLILMFIGILILPVVIAWLFLLHQSAGRAAALGRPYTPRRVPLLVR